MKKINKQKKLQLLVVIGILVLIITGCANELPNVSDEVVTKDDGESFPSEDSYVDIEKITTVYQDCRNKEAAANARINPKIKQQIIIRLGEQGYTAIDDKNQMDMTETEQVLAFCKAVDEKETARTTIIVVTDLGFCKFDLETKDGNVTVTKGYYEYSQNGTIQNKSSIHYPADMWKYTDEGYLIFEGKYALDANYVLTLSEESEHTALRIQPLDTVCRELNQKYLLPIGYERNNLFLTDWSKEDFGDLDFYDIFDKCYPLLYQQPVPYTADENLSIGAVYKIPEELFEEVIMTYFPINRETLRTKTNYLAEDAAYEYRPRGFYEAEYPDIPYPEVVNYTNNPDGTVTLFVNAVYPNGDTSKSFSHKIVLRITDEETVQYVSNQMIDTKEDYDGWHCDRLTQEEWDALYAETAGVTDRVVLLEDDSLLTEQEKKALENTALSAAESVADIYKDAEIQEDAFYASNIKDFSDEKRKDAVRLLGENGYVSVTDSANMENYEDVESFYAAYLEKRDAMVTVFHVNNDGMIGAVTMISKNEQLQSYYIGIGWQTGGIPQIKYTSVSDIAEMKLTEKGYLIYAYEDLLYHSSHCQYWRIKPLSDKCRELTEKYISGLSYVNYNLLVTNWDSSNVEDILLPCMFEDLYRIYTGENWETKNTQIPAELYEKIMTTYFPVSIKQLQETCGYNADSDSYPYEMISASPYPPFGEVIDYTENADGTLRLTVDAVRPDYNTDCAYTNIIVVQPFADGTFRYLSNHIEPKELELPPVAGAVGSA